MPDETEALTAEAATRLIAAAERAERSAGVAGHLLSLTELDGGASIEVVLALNGVVSMDEVELRVGVRQLELRIGDAGGGAQPLLVELPKTVDLDTAEKARFSRKTGQLTVTLAQL